jgi:hypothetical protein
MKPSYCSREEAVARASATGIWPEDLTSHAAGCAACREVAETARWIQALAVSNEDPGEADAEIFAGGIARPMPDPDLIWQRARLDSQNQQNSVPALEWTRTALAAAAPVGLAGWVAWNWYSIESAAGQFLIATWPQVSMVTYALASIVPAALLLAALSLGYPLFDGD